MSLKRMIWFPSCLMIRSSNIFAVSIRPIVRMFSSMVLPSMLPEGSSTFSLSTAFFTSIGVMPYPAILMGSSQRRMAYFFSPQMETLLTSEMVCNCSFTVRSAISLSSSSERFSLWRATIRMGDASASAFDTVGGSQSRGR